MVLPHQTQDSQVFYQQWSLCLPETINEKIVRLVNLINEKNKSFLLGLETLLSYQEMFLVTSTI